MTTYRKVLDFRNYRLSYSGSRKTEYNQSKVENLKKKLEVEMESHMFISADPISFLDYLLTFKRTYNNMSIHEDATCIFIYFPTSCMAKQDLLKRIEGRSNDGTDDEDSFGGALLSYEKVVNYLLQTYADDLIISSADAAINTLKERKQQSLLALKDAIFARTSQCGRLYGEAERIHHFLQGLNEDVQHQVRYYFGEYLLSTLDTPSPYAQDSDRKMDGNRYTHDDRRK